MAFKMPENLTDLKSDKLSKLLEEAIAEFDAKSGQDSHTADDLESLRTLTDAVEQIRGEIAERTQKADEIAQEVTALAERVQATDTQPDTPDTETVDPPEPAVEDSQPGVAVVASGQVRRPKLVLPKDRSRRLEITASADVPGLAAGQSVASIDDLVEGLSARARSLASAGKSGAQAYVASLKLPFPDDLIIKDLYNTAEGTAVTLAAKSQARLPGKDLVASGGWCAPSEVLYEINDIACADSLWDLPEIQLPRGGLRFFLTPELDINALTWIHTEQGDIDGNEKPCFKIPCPDPVEERCDAIGVCLEAGILTERHFPELIAWYLRNAMVAHEIRLRRQIFLEAISRSVTVETNPSMAAFSAVFGAIALQVADYIEKHSLCESIGVEIVLPLWARNLFLADLARQNGRDFSEVNVGTINEMFAELGVRVQWVRSMPPDVPEDIGGENPPEGWPQAIPFLMYAAGTFQLGRGGEINLGAVYDSNKFRTNDYTALFMEECVALINRGPEARFVIVPVCPDGATGAQLGLECPLDGGPFELPNGEGEGE